MGVHGLRACPSANSRPAAAYAAWAQGSGDEMRLPCTSENDPSTRPLLPRERKTPAPCSSSPRPNRRLPRVAPRLGPATTPPLHPARRRRERRAWLIPPTQPEQPYCRFCDARAAVEIRSTLHFTRPALSIWARKSERSDRWGCGGAPASKPPSAPTRSSDRRPPGSASTPRALLLSTHPGFTTTALLHRR